MEHFHQIDNIAKEVLKLSRDTLLVNMRFMDLALNNFIYIPYQDTLSTDGYNFYYNPIYVILRYKKEKESSTRDYLHMVLHCIFHHSFVNTLNNTCCWDLACDIAVENIINDLNIPSVKSEKEKDQQDLINKLKKRIKKLTAEKIYKYLLEERMLDSHLKELRKPFISDDHNIWYTATDKNKKGNNDNASSQNENNSTSQGTGDSNKNNQDDQTSNGENDHKNERRSNDNSFSKNGNSSTSPDVGDSNGDDQNNQVSSISKKEIEEIWKNVAERMLTDLETFSKEKGDTAGSMIQNLKSVTREKYDYTNFLRRFSVMGEALKINDEEFDYIFYTYGIKLYENMPLIEPLEYKDVKRIKEFVIAIDTSGSVQGELVQKFITKTYNIFKQEESFFTKINIHIIQCDTNIQEDAKITSQKDFDEYLKTMKLHGFGGTDFRPVFNYVDRLIEAKEFTNLKGLIYFTDGFGDFPERQPAYNTAFVFVNDEYENPEVPVWAIKMVLMRDEI